MNYPTKTEFILVLKNLIKNLTKDYTNIKNHTPQFLKHYTVYITTKFSRHCAINNRIIRFIQVFILQNLITQSIFPISQTKILIELILLLQIVYEQDISSIISSITVMQQ